MGDRWSCSATGVMVEDWDHSSFQLIILSMGHFVASWCSKTLLELHQEIEGPLSSLLVSHWPEMGHVTTSASKGCWGCKLLDSTSPATSWAGKGGEGVE